MVIEVEPLAPYQLSLSEKGEVVQQDGQLFDAYRYARMKVGILEDTEYFANKIVNHLTEAAPQIVECEIVPGLLVAYDQIPHAATILASCCLERINGKRVQAELAPGSIVKVYTPDYLDSYSSSSQTGRQQILSDKPKSIDLNQLDCMQPVIIDDIYVTGTYLRWLLELIDSPDQKQVVTAFVAKVDKALADKSPELESVLDHTGIVVLDDIRKEVENGNLIFNHRFLKMMLRADRDELISFLEFIPDDLFLQTVRAISTDKFRIEAPKIPNRSLILGQATLRGIVEV